MTRSAPAVRVLFFWGIAPGSATPVDTTASAWRASRLMGSVISPPRGADVTEDLIGYPKLVQRALKQGVVRHALEIAAGPDGLPGGHHFYITFSTQHPGVRIPDYLRKEYAEDMTIVLRNHFWDLEVTEDGFGVGLSFKEKPERLEVPFDALIRFMDPSVGLALPFDPADVPGGPKLEATPDIEPRPEEPETTESEDSSDAAPNIISLDAFRKSSET